MEFTKPAKDLWNKTTDVVGSGARDIKKRVDEGRQEYNKYIEGYKKLIEESTKRRLRRLDKLPGRQLAGTYESILSTKPVAGNVPEIRFTPKGSNVKYAIPEYIIPGIKAGEEFASTLFKLRDKAQSNTFSSPTVRETMTARTGDPTYFDQYWRHAMSLPSRRFGDVVVRPFPKLLYSNPNIFGNKTYPMTLDDKAPVERAFTLVWPVMRRISLGSGPHSKLGQQTDKEKLQSFNGGVTGNHLAHVFNSPTRSSLLGNISIHELTHAAQADELAPIRLATTFGSGMDDADTEAYTDYGSDGIGLDDYSTIPRERTQAHSAFNQQRYKLANEIRKNKKPFLFKRDGAPTKLTEQQLDTITSMPAFFRHDFRYQEGDPRRYPQFYKAMKFFKDNPGAVQLLAGEGSRFITNYNQIVDRIEDLEKRLEDLKKGGKPKHFWDSVPGLERQLKQLRKIRTKYDENSILGNLKNRNRSGVFIG